MNHQEHLYGNKMLYGDSSFWMNFCSSMEQAECVARAFPSYYLCGDVTEKALSKEAEEEALAWGMANDEEIVFALHWDVSGSSHPFAWIRQCMEIMEDEYRKKIHQGADKYVQHYERLGAAPVIVQRVISGERLHNERTAHKFMRVRHPEEHVLRWGPLKLPYQKGRLSNFCAVGMPRTGKTTLLRLFLQSLNWRNNNRRVVIYDEKSGAPSAVFVSEKEFAHPDSSSCLLNPFDSRGVAWDIARDAESPHQANEIARTLLPDHKRDNPFFTAAPRAILAAAMVSLNETRDKAWGLAELLLAVSSGHIDDWLPRSSYGEEVYSTLLGHGSPSGTDLKKTLLAELNPLRPVAAAWSQCTRRISLRSWAKEGQGALVFSNHNEYAGAMQAVNRTMLGILFESLLDLHHENSQETFVILDEFQSLGYLDNLSTVLRTGVGLGVTTVLGVHDIDLLKETYGEHAEGLLSMCGHYALLRTNSQTTAIWASQLLGQQKVRIQHRSVTDSIAKAENDGQVQASQTLSEVEKSRPMVEADQLSRLPLAGEASMLTGYFKSTLHPTYKGVMHADYRSVHGEVCQEHSGTEEEPDKLSVYTSEEISDFRSRTFSDFSSLQKLLEGLPTNDAIALADEYVCVSRSNADTQCVQMPFTEALENATRSGLDLVEFPVGLEPKHCLEMKAPWLESEATGESESHEPLQNPAEPDPKYDILEVERLRF